MAKWRAPDIDPACLREGRPQQVQFDVAAPFGLMKVKEIKGMFLLGSPKEHV